MADGSSVGFMQGFETAEQYQIPANGAKGGDMGKVPALNVATGL